MLDLYYSHSKFLTFQRRFYLMTLLLRKRELLPEEALIVAEIIDGNGRKVSREELEDSVRIHERAELEDIDKAVRLLRMTDNMIIEDEEAVLTRLDFFENEGLATDTVMHRFEEWREEAQEENLTSIAELKSK